MMNWTADAARRARPRRKPDGTTVLRVQDSRASVDAGESPLGRMSSPACRIHRLLARAAQVYLKSRTAPPRRCGKCRARARRKVLAG